MPDLALVADWPAAGGGAGGPVDPGIMAALFRPGLVSKHQWRSVTGRAATGTLNIQWGAIGRKP